MGSDMAQLLLPPTCAARIASMPMSDGGSAPKSGHTTQNPNRQTARRPCLLDAVVRRQLPQQPVRDLVRLLGRLPQHVLQQQAVVLAHGRPPVAVGGNLRRGPGPRSLIWLACVWRAYSAKQHCCCLIDISCGTSRGRTPEHCQLFATQPLAGAAQMHSFVARDSTQLPL